MHVRVVELIELRGDSVRIYGRAETGVDEYNRPVYSWSLKAEEKALIQAVHRRTSIGEIVLPAGEVSIDDRIGFFKPDSVIEEDDQVEWMGNRYDVVAVQSRTLKDGVIFKIVYLKRMVE